MTRLALIAAVVLAAAACGGGTGFAVREAAAPDVRPAATVLGLVYDGPRAELRRLDALTLRAVGASKLGGLESGTHAFSPDGRTLVLASGESPPRLRFVDARALRVRARLDLPGRGWPSRLVWAAPRRLIVLLQGDEPQVVTVDPQARRVLGSRSLPGVTVAADARGGRLVALLAPRDSIGGSRLAVVDGSGALAGIAALPAITAGSERIEHADDAYAMRSRNPGVAVSPDGRRAVVVSAGAQVAEVELDTLEVAYHDLRQPVSLLGRLRNWLEPEAQAKVVEGPYREARWLGPHHVAVTGTDYHGLKDGEWQASAVGLRLIDTRDWTVRTAAAHVTGIALVRDRLLAFGGTWPEGSTGTGLRAYGTAGDELFHALGDEPVGWVESAWPYAYVHDADGQGRRLRIVDLRSGRLVGATATRRTVSILGAAPAK